MIFDKWEFESRPFLRQDHDYFTEFLAKLDCVTIPKGEALQAAFDRAKGKEGFGDSQRGSAIACKLVPGASGDGR